MKKSTWAFIALCMAAPAFQLLERYGLFHWEDHVVFPLLLTSLVLLVVLFGWSLLSVRHHRVRALGGSLVCAYCLWQAFQNGKIIY
jgi:uncharacterized BrkB/YihY/UPF0761 family membrane protein